jgi:hypothetical protein
MTPEKLVLELAAMLGELRAFVHSVNRKVNTVMTTQTEAAALLSTVQTKLDGALARLEKVALETTGLQDAVAALQAAAGAAGALDPVLEAAIAATVAKAEALAAQAVVLDDLVPDAPATPAV